MEDLKKLYITVLGHLSGEWIYNCDGGCQYEIAQRKVLKEGPWTLTYQPKKGMPEQENGDISLFFTHKDHKTLSQDFYESIFMPVIRDVNQMFEDDFRKLLAKTDNKWLVPLKKVCTQEILQIEPWTIADDKKRIRSLQTLRGGDWDFDCRSFSFRLPHFGGKFEMQYGDETEPEEFYAALDNCKSAVDNL